MVSEDPQDLGGLPVVHRLLDLRYLNHAWHRKVPPKFHQFDDPNELLEIALLGSSKRMLLEERNDFGPEILEPIDIESQEVLPMIVMSTVPIDLAASEEPNQIFQRRTT